MKKILAFLKKEIVFCIAFLCAAVSALFVPPSRAYFGYVDWSTLFILFALMGVVGEFRSCGIFGRMGSALCRRFHTERSLCAVLVFLCFFSSMILTNDVALLTFVPFALALLSHITGGSIVLYTVVLQTLAANCGSMLTPLGNPQNLFLFQQTGLSLGEFMQVTLPYTLLSAVMLFLATLLVPSKPIFLRSIPNSPAVSENAESSTPKTGKKFLLAREIVFPPFLFSSVSPVNHPQMDGSTLCPGRAPSPGQKDSGKD